MLNLLKPLAIGAMMISGSAAFAQETTEAPATEETAADPAADLAMGTEVEGELAVGAAYIREEFGDWALRCMKAEEGTPDPCQLYQLLFDANGKPSR